MSASNILIVDDSEEFRTKVRKSLGQIYPITEAASESEFHALYRPYTYDLVILDMRLKSGREGLRLLREILARDELQPVIMVSAYGDTDAVIDSTEAGALMFLHKQEFSPELLARMVEAILEQARTRRHLAALQARAPAEPAAFLAGSNPAVRRMREQLARAAESSDCVVLLAGKPGAGQYPAAQSLHSRSRRRSVGPLLTASGRLLAEGDAEVALFGAPSRLHIQRKGLLEQALGGVLLLDQAEMLPASCQTRLWEALVSREYTGGQGTVPVDVQLLLGVATANVERMEDHLRRGGIHDLVIIELPALRERREDIALLASARLQTLRQQGRTSAHTFSHAAIQALERHAWPGNLAELDNAVEYAAIQANLASSNEIDEHHLPSGIREGDGAAQNENYQIVVARAEIDLVEQILHSGERLTNSELAARLGYSDRFAIARRLRNAFAVAESLAGEYPLTAQRFLSRTRAA